MRSPARHVTLATVAVAALLTLMTGTAGAHSDEGAMQILSFDQTAPLSATIEVGVTFVNDGHLAPDAAVQATLSGPNGATVGPIPLPGGGEGSGLYRAEVTLPEPGTWTVEVTSTEPTATASGSLGVSAEAAGSPEVPPGAVAEQPSSENPDISTAVAPVSEAPGELLDGKATDGDGDTEEDRNIGIIVIAFGAAIVIAGAVFAISRRKQTALQADGGSDVEVS